MRRFFLYTAILLLPALFACAGIEQKRQKTIALVSGNSIHYWGDHENELAAELFKGFLLQALPDTKVLLVKLDKGDSVDVLENADAVVIFGEGEKNHPFFQNTALLEKLHNKGVSFGILHYALHFETPEESAVCDTLVGGHYDIASSVNPFWHAKFEKLAAHEACNGVRPFDIDDEWYFNIRFAQNGGQKIIPLAVAAPADKVRKGRNGPHTGNDEVRANMGKDEIIAWLCENPNGTRGFGITGAHTVFIYRNPDFRKLAVNMTAWLAKIEIPENGFSTTAPTVDEIAARITKELRSGYDAFIERWRERDNTWNSAHPN